MADLAFSTPYINNSGGKGKSGGSSGYSYKPYRPKTYETLSPLEALAQARTTTDPLRMEDRTNAGVINQQQARLLGQAMNARGHSGDGTAATANIGLSNDFQRNLSGIDNRYNSQAAALAQAIQQRSQDRADAQGAQDFQRWQGGQQLGLQAFGANRGAFESDRSFEQQQQMNLLTKAIQEAGLTGKYQGQSTLEAQKWQASPESQADYLDLWRQQQLLNIANLQRSAYAPYGGSSGGGSSGGGGSVAPSSTDYTNMRWIEERARELAAADTRRCEGGGAAPEGQWSVNDLYDSYKKQLYQQLGYIP